MSRKFPGNRQLISPQSTEVTEVYSVAKFKCILTTPYISSIPGKPLARLYRWPFCLLSIAAWALSIGPMPGPGPRVQKVRWQGGCAPLQIPNPEAAAVPGTFGNCRESNRIFSWIRRPLLRCRLKDLHGRNFLAGVKPMMPVGMKRIHADFMDDAPGFLFYMMLIRFVQLGCNAISPLAVIIGIHRLFFFSGNRGQGM